MASPGSFAFIGYFTTTGPGTVTIRETPVVAPEPSSLALVGLGLTGLGLVRQRRR